MAELLAKVFKSETFLSKGQFKHCFNKKTGELIKRLMHFYWAVSNNQKDCLNQDRFFPVQSFGLSGEHVREMNTTLNVAYLNSNSPSLDILASVAGAVLNPFPHVNVYHLSL